MGKLRFALAPGLRASGMPLHKGSTHEVSGNSNRGRSRNRQVPESTPFTIADALEIASLRRRVEPAAYTRSLHNADPHGRRRRINARGVYDHFPMHHAQVPVAVP